MGLSSSQARLLNLTARMHQIEYKAARLEAMKLQMANDSRRVYEDYLEALDKTKIQIKTLTKDGSVTYRDLKNYDDFLSAGYALVYEGKIYSGSAVTYKGSDGKVYADTNTYTAEEAEKDGDGTYRKLATGEFIPAEDVEITEEIPGGSFEQLLSDIINAHGNADSVSISTLSGNSFETALTNVINSGWVTIITKDPETKAFPTYGTLKYTDLETSVSTNTGLQEITDEVQLKKAEAKYEADMKAIDLKDRKYDTDLAALDTERNAIKSEMETLKTVARDNVERTFKLFS